MQHADGKKTTHNRAAGRYIHRPVWEHRWIHSCDWTTSRVPWAHRAIQSWVRCSRQSARHTDMICHSTYNIHSHLQSTTCEHY